MARVGHCHWKILSCSNQRASRHKIHPQIPPWLCHFVPSLFSCQAGLLPSGSGCCCPAGWIPGAGHPGAPSTACRSQDLAWASLPDVIQASTAKTDGLCMSLLCPQTSGQCWKWRWEGGKETGLINVRNKGHGAGWGLCGCQLPWLWLLSSNQPNRMSQSLDGRYPTRCPNVGDSPANCSVLSKEALDGSNFRKKQCPDHCTHQPPQSHLHSSCVDHNHPPKFGSKKH